MGIVNGGMVFGSDDDKEAKAGQDMAEDAARPDLRATSQEWKEAITEAIA